MSKQGDYGFEYQWSFDFPLADGVMRRCRYYVLVLA